MARIIGSWSRPSLRGSIPLDSLESLPEAIGLLLLDLSQKSARITVANNARTVLG